MSATAYFDVDGTLISTNLLHPTAYYFANQASPLKTVQRLGKAIFDKPRMALGELQDRRIFNEILFSLPHFSQLFAGHSSFHGR